MIFNIISATLSVNEDSFTVMLNDEVLATVADRIGSESILKLRSYGGFFTEFFIERAEGRSKMTCSSYAMQNGKFFAVL